MSTRVAREAAVNQGKETASTRASDLITLAAIDGIGMGVPGAGLLSSIHHEQFVLSRTAMLRKLGRRATLERNPRTTRLRRSEDLEGCCFSLVAPSRARGSAAGFRPEWETGADSGNQRAHPRWTTSRLPPPVGCLTRDSCGPLQLAA